MFDAPSSCQKFKLWICKNEPSRAIFSKVRQTRVRSTSKTAGPCSAVHSPDSKACSLHCFCTEVATKWSSSLSWRFLDADLINDVFRFMKSGATINWAQIVYLTYHPNVDQSSFSLRLSLLQVSSHLYHPFHLLIPFITNQSFFSSIHNSTWRTGLPWEEVPRE